MFMVKDNVRDTHGARCQAPHARAALTLASRQIAHNQFEPLTATDDNDTTNTPGIARQPPTCVPTKIPSAAKRSTLARCVVPPPTDPPDVEIPLSRHKHHYIWRRGTHQDNRGVDADGNYRASCTSVVTARSSASRTARPSPCSSRGRTPARSHGRPFTDGCIRRVSLRLVRHPRTYTRLGESQGCEI
jgi:hypothetical protein